MKRISLLVAIVVLAPAVSQASLYNSQRYRVRYSPYSFNYHNSGLVSGGIKYSPHAFNSHSTGLVYEGVRYTPYAFNYHNSGLVIDYYRWPTSYCAPVQVVESCPAPRSSAATSQARRRAYAARRHSISAEKLREIRETDGQQIVRRYLQAQGLDNVHIDRRLCIENRTAGAAFILRDKNLVVRYTNPQIIESLETEGGSRMKAVQRYERDWEAFASNFEANGGNVYRVDASKPDHIVAALAACDVLNPDGAGERTTMVARGLK